MHMQLSDLQSGAERAALWVLLWSQSQRALHVEPLAETLRSNLRAFIASRSMDYVPLFIGAEDACRAAADGVRGTIDRRESVIGMNERGSD